MGALVWLYGHLKGPPPIVPADDKKGLLLGSLLRVYSRLCGPHKEKKEEGGLESAGSHTVTIMVCLAASLSPEPLFSHYKWRWQCQASLGTARLERMERQAQCQCPLCPGPVGVGPGCSQLPNPEGALAHALCKGLQCHPSVGVSLGY